MSFLRHKQIYRPILPAAALARRPGRCIVSMSLRPAIPWRVALLQQSPAMLNRVAETVNHRFVRGGEFSTGTSGNFRPALTDDEFPRSKRLGPSNDQ